MRRFLFAFLALILVAGSLTRAFAVASQVVLVSVNLAGNAAAGGAAISQEFTDPRVISANGRFCVFINNGPGGEVALPTPGQRDVYFRDLQSGVTSLVSVNATGTAGGNGFSYNPAISADGRFVAFCSTATNLTSIPDSNLAFDVFVRDMSTGQTTLCSVNRTGTAAGNGDSFDPVLSADGRYVAFLSKATDLTANMDTNNTYDVYVRDLQTSTTVLASVSTTGTAGNGACLAGFNLSADGRMVAFSSAATNLTSIPDTNGGYDIFVRDLDAGTTSLVSVNQSGTGAGNVGNVSNTGIGAVNPAPWISPDHRHVLFSSLASNLTNLPDSNGVLDAFDRDLLTGTTTLLSTNKDGTAAAAAASAGTTVTHLSPDGNFVGMVSDATDMVALTKPSTTSVTRNAYLRDLRTTSNLLLTPSVSQPGFTADGDTARVRVSAGGLNVLFDSTGHDVTTDSPGIRAVYVRNTATNITQLVSRTQSGAAPNGTSAFPELSDDGHMAFFESIATNLTSLPDTNGGADEFAVMFDNAPTAIDDAYTAQAGKTLSILPPGVLANDTDPDGDPLNAVLVTNPSHGSLTLSPSGGITYTPDAGFLGNDSFTYRATDGSITSTLATVTLTVNGIAPPSALTATVDDTRVDLSWQPSPEATSYNVKRSTTAGGPYGLIGSVTRNSFADATVSDGATYFYVVTAVTGTGEGANSNEASAALPPTYAVSGKVTAGGVALAGALVDGAGELVTTAADGTYTLTRVHAGAYLVQAWTPGYSFANRVVTVGPSQSGVDFTAPTYLGSSFTVTGTVSAGGVPLNGVHVAGAGQTVTTAADGSYTLTNVSPGTYLVQAWSPGYSFTNRVVTVGPSQSGVDFTAPTYLGSSFTVTGTVSAGGVPLAGALVTGAGQAVVTGNDGTYRLTNVPTGYYLVQAWATGYTFPDQLAVVGPSQSGVNFAAP